MESDKINLNDLEPLKDRDHSFRTVIENKKYDTCHEDDLCRLLVKNDRWGSMLLIRYEYYLSKTYHGLGKGDLVFFDQKNDKLYAVELKSLKDKYSSTTEQSKITKCIEQSVKYAEAAQEWAGRKAIPVTVIEYPDGEVRVEERHTQVLRAAIETSCTPPGLTVPALEQFSNENSWAKKPPIMLEPLEEDKWYSHPGDQTQTQYKINGDTLEAKRVIDYEPSANSRKSFRKRVERVAKECTSQNIKQYYLTMIKDEDIIMTEMHPIEDL